MAAWPSNRICWHNPESEATASKIRPTLEVQGECSPFLSICAITRISDSVNDCTGKRSSLLNSRSPSISKSTPRAVRRGSRMAEGPPGNLNLLNEAIRLKDVQSVRRNSPPHSVPSGPKPAPSQATPMTGPSNRFSAMHAAT